MKFLKNIKKCWSEIRIVDRYLIIIMIILIIYSITTLLINTISTISLNVDVVARTTIASIFGYFVSSNFLENQKDFKEKKETSNNINKNNEIQEQIIGILCICSILILFSTRYFVKVDSNAIATLSQFRDIISGSIGFLIGIPPDPNK